MPRSCVRWSLFVSSILGAAALLVSADAAAADTCADGRCSTARATLKLDGKEALRTSIDTGWMPSCDNGVEHCNKGLQVRANIALTAVVAGDNLFTAQLGPSAAVQAAWPDEGRLELRTAELTGQDAILSVKHALTPQVELFVDIGPFEQGWAFSATRLLQLIPGARFEYSASASAPFTGWAFGGASVVVPPPALQSAQLFAVDLNKLSSDMGKIANGTLSLHARTSPTITYKTTKVIVAGRELRGDATSQIEFPPGDFDALDLPATIEGELSAKGDIDVLPAATLSNLGDMEFSPAVTITFSSVKATKHYDSQPQKYVFPDKTIHIPLPNIKKLLGELDGGEVDLGTDGTVPAVVTNTGEAPLRLRLESSDPRFVVSQAPIEVAPKSDLALNIAFRPEALGDAEATIRAYTNDPDSPEITFKVSATGVEPGTAGSSKGKRGASADDADAASASDAGCGCKTSGTSSSSYAGFGALALAAMAFVRRRR